MIGVGRRLCILYWLLINSKSVLSKSTYLGVRESDLGCDGDGDRILDRVVFFIVDDVVLLIEDVVLRRDVVP